MAEASATSRSKFIIITHEFAPVRGGAATYAQELGNALHRIGATVEVWAPDYGRRDHTEEATCPVVRLRVGGTLGMLDTIRLARAMAAKQSEWEFATVILTSVGAHMAFMLMSAKCWPQRNGMISVLHGSEVLRFGGNPIWRTLARRFYRRVKRVVTVSKFSKSSIEEGFLSFLAGNIVIAPAAGSSAAARIMPRRSNDGKIRVLTMARIHPRKGQVDTARALARLPQEMRGHLVYQIGGAGNANYLMQVERTCEEFGVAFEYLGEVESARLASVYAACDIYVMSSRTLPKSVEGFGITYLDAGFHEKPVVGYRSGGAAEAVMDGETGLLVAEGDVAALSNALKRLIEDKALRVRLGAGGRRRAGEFSWATTARIFQKLRNE